MAVPSAITDLSISEASNSPSGSDVAASNTGPDDYLRALSAIIRREQAQGANVASASTVNLGAIADGNYVHITGTTAITSFGTVAAGVERTVVFDGALTLTHNATSLILPGGVNITTAAGDVATFRSEGSGNFRCTNYIKASGAPIGSYQPLDSDLTAIAALTTTAFGRGMLVYADAATAFAALKQAASATATGVVELATNAEAVTGTDTARAVTPAGVAAAIAANVVSAGVAQATISGTNFDYTGLASTLNRITIVFNEVSLSGTDDILVRLGYGGTPTYETTGYVSTSAAIAAAGTGVSTSTAGLVIRMGGSAAAVFSGTMVLTQVSANVWIASHNGKATTTYTVCGGGSITTTSTLTAVRVLASGANTFDNGSVNILLG